MIFPDGCPHCGGDNTVTCKHGDNWWVKCEDCHARGPRVGDEDSAIKWWNETYDKLRDERNLFAAVCGDKLTALHPVDAFRAERLRDSVLSPLWETR